MVDFSHLKQLETAGKTATYTISCLAGEPTLTVKPATESNKGYFNAVLRQTKKTLKSGKKNVSAKMLKENREDDKELYAEHVIIGWKGINDSNMDSVEFSPENVLGFITELPDWIFDDLRVFCGDNLNFVEEQVDIEDRLGN